MHFRSFIQRSSAVVSLAIATGVAAIALPATAFAHPCHGTAKHDPALLSAVVAMGGGADAFSAKTLRVHLGGRGEQAKLMASLGAATLTRFDTVFTFVVRDALATMKQNGSDFAAPAPAPDPADTKAVAAALYKAGLDDGKFDIEKLFDTLFSQDVHMHAMMAVGRNYGGAGESAYHQVFGRLVADVGGNGAAGNNQADLQMHDRMDGMNMKGMTMPSTAASHAPH